MKRNNIHAIYDDSLQYDEAWGNFGTMSVFQGEQFDPPFAVVQGTKKMQRVPAGVELGDKLMGRRARTPDTDPRPSDDYFECSSGAHDFSVTKWTHRDNFGRKLIEVVNGARLYRRNYYCRDCERKRAAINRQRRKLEKIEGIVAKI